MTGSKVVWTDEMRNRMREKMRAARANETQAQKDERKARRSKTIEENPQKWKERNKKISQTRLSDPEKFSKLAKEAIERKTDAAKERSLGCLILPKEERVDLNRRSANKRKEKQEGINKKIAKSVQSSWDSMSEQERTERSSKALVSQAGDYTLINGSVLRCHSSWEAHCANTLVRLGVDFKPQQPFYFEELTYFADFVLYDQKTIIEVKGHPEAWKRWKEETFPALQRHLDHSLKVYMVDRDISSEEYLSYDDFVSRCVFVFPPAV